VIDYTATLIASLRDFAEEVSATGLRQDALLRAAEQYNEILKVVIDQESNNPIWSHVTPVNVASVTSSELSLACNELLHIVKRKDKEHKSERVWHITRNAKLQGSYSGLVMVHSGAEFCLQGMVSGTIVLLGNSHLIWQGCATGVIEQSPESTIKYQGSIEASIRTVTNLEEKYKEILAQANADPA